MSPSKGESPVLPILVFVLALVVAMDSVTLVFVVLSIHELRRSVAELAPRDPEPQRGPL